ncbi:MAG: hypothetical protein F7B60_00455 [Desulfurococcales archaeon]|nr:hypothetical protein [Desulfurococcales archaeon]
MSKMTMIITVLILLVVAGGLWFHYGNHSIFGITGRNAFSKTSTVSNSRLKVNEGEGDHIRVKILYASEVRGIRVVEFVYTNATRYEYVYPFDGYTGYLFKVNATNEGSQPAHLEFYLITNDGKRIWPEDHTVFSDYVEGIPKDVLCNSIRIPTSFSDDRIKNIKPNTTSTVFLYYSIELGEKPAYLYIEGRYSNGEAFNFTAPLSLTG